MILERKNGVKIMQILLYKEYNIKNSNSIREAESCLNRSTRMNALTWGGGFGIFEVTLWEVKSKAGILVRRLLE